jgi:hypothetical protein
MDNVHGGNVLVNTVVFCTSKCLALVNNKNGADLICFQIRDGLCDLDRGRHLVYNTENTYHDPLWQYIYRYTL